MYVCVCVYVCMYVSGRTSFVMCWEKNMGHFYGCILINLEKYIGVSLQYSDQLCQ